MVDTNPGGGATHNDAYLPAPVPQPGEMQVACANCREPFDLVRGTREFEPMGLYFCTGDCQDAFDQKVIELAPFIARYNEHHKRCFVLVAEVLGGVSGQMRERLDAVLAVETLLQDLAVPSP